jgi:hypothetical protein
LKTTVKKPKAKPKASEWPFLDLPNTVVLAHTAIFKHGEAVVQVAHEEEDGAWQFLDGVSPKTFSAACMASLAQVLTRDPSLAEIADLPMGWRAKREGLGKKWLREKLPELPPELAHTHHGNCGCGASHAPKKSRVRIKKTKVK